MREPRGELNSDLHLFGSRAAVYQGAGKAYTRTPVDRRLSDCPPNFKRTQWNRTDGSSSERTQMESNILVTETEGD